MTVAPLSLYASPLACSLASHLALAEAGLDPELIWVSRFTRALDDGADFRAIHPAGKVPALRIGERLLSENVAVLLAIQELLPDEAPERLELIRWLAFIATELHRGVLNPTFDPEAPQATKDDVLRRHLPPVLTLLEAQLAGRETLLERPSVADAYLFWATMLLTRTAAAEAIPPGLKAAFEARAARPVTQRVVDREMAEFQRLRAVGAA